MDFLFPISIFQKIMKLLLWTLISNKSAIFCKTRMNSGIVKCILETNYNNIFQPPSQTSFVFFPQ